MPKASRSTLHLPVMEVDDGEDGSYSGEQQDPVVQDDENTWRAGEVEGAVTYAGNRPTMRLDSIVRRRCFS